MKIDIHKSVDIEPTIRTELLSSMFEVPASTKLSVSLTGELPDDERMRNYNIGLIVGPSGSGKTLLLNSIFGCPSVLGWSRRSVIDDFPSVLSMEDISRVCQSVGFNTIPSWLRPFNVLSNGERFRVETARLLLDNSRSPVTIDEFTSVVDRQVAQFACHAIQKYVRSAGKRLVVASCHYDIIPWLQPDWILEPGNPCRFTWRSLQGRPSISCSVSRCKYETWQLFREFHYMSQELNKAARCYGLYVNSSGLDTGPYNEHIHSSMDRGEGDRGDGLRPRVSADSLENRTGDSRLVLQQDDRIESEQSFTTEGSSYSTHPRPPRSSDSRLREGFGRRAEEDESVDSLSTEETGRFEETVESEATEARYTRSTDVQHQSEIQMADLEIRRHIRRPIYSSDSYRITSLCGVLYRPHPRVSDIYGFTRMVTLPDFQGLGLAFVLACKVASAYKALGKRLHSYPNHPAWIRSYQRSKDWIQVKDAGQFSPKRGQSSTVSGFGGRRCAVFFYVGDAMNKEEAERLVNVEA